MAQRIPLRKGTTPISPLTKGDKGGCKLVLVKMGNSHGKTQPPESPFIKGDCIGII